MPKDISTPEQILYGDWALTSGSDQLSAKLAAVEQRLLEYLRHRRGKYPLVGCDLDGIKLYLGLDDEIEPALDNLYKAGLIRKVGTGWTLTEISLRWFRSQHDQVR